jgi:hypothetical protein
MKKRNPTMRLTVYLVAAVLLAAGTIGCSSTASPTPDEPPTDDESQAVAQRTEAGPFEIAVDWASAVSEKTPPQGLRQVVGEWKFAQVARVWASGEEYRAVVVQQNTARETLAVLLHIARSDAGTWEVVDSEPTTSTHLWSEL